MRATKCPEADRAAREAIRRGGWRPGRWTMGDQHLLITIAYMIALVRALDYATGDDPKNRTIAVAEIVMPLYGWAIALTVGAAVLLYGRLVRRHLVVTIGHVILATLYASLAFGTLASYAAPILDGVYDTLCVALHWTGWMPAPDYYPWRIDGIRNAGPLLLVAAVHAVTALRTGITPLDASDSTETVELVQAPQEDGGS